VDKTLLEKGEQNAGSISNTASNSVGGSQVSSSTSAAETRILSLTGRLGVQITTVGEYIRVKSVYQANRKGAFFPGDRIKRINGKEIVGIAAKALPKLLKKGENEIELVRMGIDDMPQLQKKNEGATVPALVTARASTITPSLTASASTTIATSNVATISGSTAVQNSSNDGPISIISPPVATERRIITIHAVRNNTNPSKARKFRLYSDYALSKLRSGYLKAYKKSGCRHVTFYLRGTAMTNDNATIGSLNITNSDIVIAMENGKTL